NVLRNEVEVNDAIVTNNDKVRYLRYIEDLLRHYMVAWKEHDLNPALTPKLIDVFTDVFYKNITGQSMIPDIEQAPYEVGKIVASIFVDNPGYERSRLVLFKKFTVLHPDKILANLGPFVNEPFA